MTTEEMIRQVQERPKVTPPPALVKQVRTYVRYCLKTEHITQEMTWSVVHTFFPEMSREHFDTIWILQKQDYDQRHAR